MEKDKIAILIPAYNEEAYIRDVAKKCIPYNMDIIIVDDGSSDNTVSIIKNIPQPKNCKIVLIKHPKNLGKGQSLKTGFNYVIKNNYTGVITIDADGQHDTGEILKFLKKLQEENPDIIVGNRLKNTKDMPFIRLATNVFTSWVISLLAGKKIRDVQSGYRYISSNILKKIDLETGNFDTEPEILLKASWLGYKIKNILIRTIYHENFISHVNPLKDTIKFFKLVFRSIKQRKLYLKNASKNRIDFKKNSEQE